ncbi:D-alanine--poly(phosphoribitol) ligase subunit DltC [Lachnoclostridium sp. An181]|uniref:D-alanine--poly(phosphoribitol) ligase subunit DltC n=1 Tax=Lachnoclostridium sp. An181 TaxID=1965575 RepID=UPI000B38B157|nr:D-alanine--poly(phosphoribitol) ligase subunit DltC [Lachnoclostridium sp. An181]OUP49597.1 D-alanine--poly(phosphoribitol) ligase subunit 2 [Lachnoclostridium sp. An181]
MREEILELLAEICDDDLVMEDENTELLESGLLDSLAFAELLAELEERFGIVIAPSEIERSDVDTPAKVIALVETRRA